MKSVVKSRRRFYYTHCKRLCYVATSNVLFALIDFVPSLSQRIIASHLILNLIERSLAFTRSSDRLIDNELLVKYIFFCYIAFIGLDRSIEVEIDGGWIVAHWINYDSMNGERINDDTELFCMFMVIAQCWFQSPYENDKRGIAENLGD